MCRPQKIMNASVGVAIINADGNHEPLADAKYHPEYLTMLPRRRQQLIY